MCRNINTFYTVTNIQSNDSDIVIALLTTTATYPKIEKVWLLRQRMQNRYGCRYEKQGMHGCGIEGVTTATVAMETYTMDLK